MRLKYIVIDVDGTMTDAGVYYDENGNEQKKFCTRDAAGFFAAKNRGINVIVLTGRECSATARRMNEMKVEHLFQNIKKKKEFLEQFIINNKINKEEIGYIGDDLNDLGAMSLCGFVACPIDACLEVKNIANYISNTYGGQGVVRDVIEFLLKENSEWELAIKDIYGVGI